MFRIHLEKSDRQAGAFLGSVVGVEAAAVGFGIMGEHEAPTPDGAIASTELPVVGEHFLVGADIAPGALAVSGLALIAASVITLIKNR